MPDEPTPPAAMSRADYERECRLFWMLVTKAARRDDVGRVYLAIQATLAFEQARVDVGELLGAMMPEGQRTSGAEGEVIGAEGLAYFYWLFEVELAEAGGEDCHAYRFRRRWDGAETLARVRTAEGPGGLEFSQRYARMRRKLEGKRAGFSKANADRAVAGNLGGPSTPLADSFRSE